MGHHTVLSRSSYLELRKLKEALISSTDSLSGVRTLALNSLNFLSSNTSNDFNVTDIIKRKNAQLEFTETRRRLKEYFKNLSSLRAKV